MDGERGVNFTYRGVEGEGENVCLLEDGSETYAKVDATYFHGGEGEDYGFNLTHPNYLHTRFLNVQADDSGQIGLSERIYDFFDQTFEEYVNSLEHKIETVAYLTRNGDEEEFRFINPKIKEVIRSMISFVLYIHSKELTFRWNLDYRTHFGVLEGVLKFWRVSFSRSTRHVDRRQDFKQIARIITQRVLHGIGQEQLPECLGDLLRLMASDFPEHWLTYDYKGYNDVMVTVEKFFYSHISLMPSGERLNFIMNCHNKVDCLDAIESSHFKSALFNMGNNTNWVDRLGTSISVLYISIMHGILKEERHETSVAEAIVVVERLNIPDYLYRVRQRYNVANRNIISVNRDIVTVCRNVVTHSYGVVKLVRGTHENVEIDAAIMKTFGDLLTLLQEELFKRDLLSYFME